MNHDSKLKRDLTKFAIYIETKLKIISTYVSDENYQSLYTDYLYMTTMVICIHQLPNT
jgi:hypothetical protein